MKTLTTPTNRPSQPLPPPVFAVLPLLAGALWLSAAPLRAQTAPPTPAAEATPPPLEEPPPSNVSITPAGPGKSAATPAPEGKPVEMPRAQNNGEGPTFIGSQGCNSSLCHGGGAPLNGRNAYPIWKKLDHHSRSFATLSTDRSARMASAVHVLNATESVKCTVCHAPLVTVAPARLGPGVKPADEGVSCESCHGPAQNWIRSHTRPDLTHAQNVQTGVRELNGLYARANACVACHQVLPPELLTEGKHPPLIFELDAQMTAEPRHWPEDGEFIGPKAWLVGQAVALRETSASLSRDDSAQETIDQWRALVWLLQRATEAYGDALPKIDVPNAEQYIKGNVQPIWEASDNLAKVGGRTSWTRGSTRRTLDALAGTSKDFTPAPGDGISPSILQHRAQRLVLSLSRLLGALQEKDMQAWAPAKGEFDKLVDIMDAKREFSASAFADQLRKFQGSLASKDNASGVQAVAER